MLEGEFRQQLLDERAALVKAIRGVSDSVSRMDTYGIAAVAASVCVVCHVLLCLCENASVLC